MKQKYHLYSFIIALAAFYLVSATGCKKSEDAQTHETGTVTDRDGNVYKTVKIGNQWWMAENLRAKTYRNGDSVLYAESDVQWQDTIAAYCHFDNKQPAAALGLLYNWYVVSNKKNIAPTGWHIPSDEEWKTLEKSVGMSAEDVEKVNWRGTHEGEKLKVSVPEAPQAWTKYGDVWADNQSGFTALAGGCRLFDGRLSDPGASATGFWWSATPTHDMAWYRYLDYKNANVFRFYASKNYGCSIRCVKD